MIAELCGAFVALLFLIFLVPRYWKGRASITAEANVIANDPQAAGATVPITSAQKPTPAAHAGKKKAEKKKRSS